MYEEEKVVCVERKDTSARKRRCKHKKMSVEHGEKEQNVDGGNLPFKDECAS